MRRRCDRMRRRHGIRVTATVVAAVVSAVIRRSHRMTATLTRSDRMRIRQRAAALTRVIDRDWSGLSRSNRRMINRVVSVRMRRVLRMRRKRNHVARILIISHDRGSSDAAVVIRRRNRLIVIENRANRNRLVAETLILARNSFVLIRNLADSHRETHALITELVIIHMGDHDVRCTVVHV